MSDTNGHKILHCFRNSALKMVALATRIKYGPFIDINIIYVLSILRLNIFKMTWNVYDVYDLFIHTK